MPLRTSYQSGVEYDCDFLGCLCPEGSGRSYENGSTPLYYIGIDFSSREPDGVWKQLKHHNSMKKSFLALAGLALVLAGCAKKEDVSNLQAKIAGINGFTTSQLLKVRYAM